MRDENRKKLDAEDARAGETHDRSWLIMGIVIAAAIVVIAAVFLM